MVHTYIPALGKLRQHDHKLQAGLGYVLSLHLKKRARGLESGAQGLRTLVALPKNPGPIASTHTAGHNCL